MKNPTAIDIINSELEKDTLTDYGRKLLEEFKEATDNGSVQKMIRLESEMKKAKDNFIFYKDKNENENNVIIWSDFSDARINELEKLNPRAKELIAILIEMKKNGNIDILKFNSIKKELEEIEKRNGSLGRCE